MKRLNIRLRPAWIKTIVAVLCSLVLLSPGANIYAISAHDYDSLIEEAPLYDKYPLGNCRNSGFRTASSHQSWDPLTLTYPDIPDEPALIEAVRQFILQPGAYPNSPFAHNPQYVNSIFTLSKQHNVNPLLILSIAKQENQFGSIGAAATEKNNYFGITYSENGQKTYRTFATPEEGIEYFIIDVSGNISDPDNLYRKRGLTNFYEYLSIHQMGFVAYPGEYPPEAPGANATPPYLFEDSLMGELGRITWESQYTPKTYYENSISFINAVTGLSLPDTPRKQGSCAADGYSFPLAPQRQVDYSNLPCIGTNRIQATLTSPTTGAPVPTCHHDGTAAFDLSYGGVAGKEVYAIVGGDIVLFSTWGGTCQSVQLRGKDGYHYWYGHITSVPQFVDVHNLPSPVEPGQQIGVVDTWSSDNNCQGTSGGTHLHIDRGRPDNAYGGMGGYQDGRDPDFVTLLQKLYDDLNP